MSDGADAGPRSRTSRSGQTTHTSSALVGGSVIARARELARPRPPLTKRERQSDGYERVRTIGNGRRGQPTAVEMDGRAIGEVLRAVLAGHEGLVASASLTGRDRRAVRVDARSHLELAAKLIASFLDGEPHDRDEQASVDLVPSRASEIGASLVCGAILYSGSQTITARHIGLVRVEVERRGMELTKIGPHWWRVTPRDARPPAQSTCSACGYSRVQRDGRCARCGTQTRPA